MDMDVHGSGEKELTAKEFLYKNLKADDKEYFRHKDKKFLSYVCDAWMSDESNSKHRYDTMKHFIPDEQLKKSQILDIASGCGTFVFYGLINGYDVYGIEPSQWKHQFNILKAKEKGYPDVWMQRFCYGVGEYLPYKDETFDIISTYQTLEHVQSLTKCFHEFGRVLRKGGYLFIRCPDYRSFFEGHYRIPMLPLMNRSLFKIYLKILKRPIKGLNTINYITPKMIFDHLGNDYSAYDISLNQIKSRIYNKIKIDSTYLARAYLAYSHMKNIFRRENSVNVIAIKND